QPHLLVVVYVIVRDRDVVRALLRIDTAIERGIARTGTFGQRCEDGVVIDPDVGWNAGGHAFDGDRVGAAAAGQQAEGHVAHDHVRRRTGDVDAEVGRGTIVAEDGDVVLLLDLNDLRRQLPLRTGIGDGPEVEDARVVEDQPARAIVGVDGGL